MVDAATDLGTVRSIFRRWDTNNNNRLERHEFIKLFVDCGMTETAATQMFDVVDVDGNGAVDYEEFLDWLQFPGKSYFVTGGGLSVSTNSKQAIQNITQELGKGNFTELKYCCVNTTMLATLKCNECKKYYSQSGFSSTHDSGDLREHTYMPISQEKSDAPTTLGNGQVVRMIDDTANLKPKIELQKELKKQFRLYDLDMNGSISLEEMTSVALKMAKFCGNDRATETHVRPQARQIMRKLDKDRNGTIEVSEYLEALTQDSMNEYGAETALSRAKEMTATMQLALKG